MNENNFGEQQIFKALNELATGCTVDEICSRYGIFQSTLYSWKSKFGGIEFSEVKYSYNLEAENVKLKNLLEKTMLEKTVLEEVLSKNSSI